jgi:hypothetical protein
MANCRRNLVLIHLLWGVGVIGQHHHLDFGGMCMVVTLLFGAEITTTTVHFGLPGL